MTLAFPVCDNPVPSWSLPKVPFQLRPTMDAFQSQSLPAVRQVNRSMRPVHAVVLPGPLSAAFSPFCHCQINGEQIAVLCYNNGSFAQFLFKLGRSGAAMLNTLEALGRPMLPCGSSAGVCGIAHMRLSVVLSVPNPWKVGLFSCLVQGSWLWLLLQPKKGRHGVSEKSFSGVSGFYSVFAFLQQ